MCEWHYERKERFGSFVILSCVVHLVPALEYEPQLQFSLRFAAVQCCACPFPSCGRFRRVSNWPPESAGKLIWAPTPNTVTVCCTTRAVCLLSAPTHDGPRTSRQDFSACVVESYVFRSSITLLYARRYFLNHQLVVPGPRMMFSKSCARHDLDPERVMCYTRVLQSDTVFDPTPYLETYTENNDANFCIGLVCARTKTTTFRPPNTYEYKTRIHTRDLGWILYLFGLGNMSMWRE